MGWPTMDPINQNPGGLGEGGGPGNSRPGRWNDNVGPPADSEDGRAMKLKPAPHQAGARTPPGRSLGDSCSQATPRTRTVPVTPAETA